MCGRYRRTTAQEELARRYRISVPPQRDLPISWNIAPMLMFSRSDGNSQSLNHDRTARSAPDSHGSDGGDAACGRVPVFVDRGLNLGHDDDFGARRLAANIRCRSQAADAQRSTRTDRPPRPESETLRRVTSKEPFLGDGRPRNSSHTCSSLRL
jgi:hypothetical protein